LQSFYLFLIPELSADFLSSVQGGQWKETEEKDKADIQIPGHPVLFVLSSVLNPSQD